MVTSFQRPTGTYLPVTQAQIDEAFKTQIAALCQAYLSKKEKGLGGDRAAIKDAIAVFNDAMSSNGIAQGAIMDCYRAYHRAGTLKVASFQLIGWMLTECFPEIRERIISEFGLMPEHRPFPEPEPVAAQSYKFGPSPWDNPSIPLNPPAQETAAIATHRPAPPEEDEPISLRGEIAVDPEGYKKFLSHIPVTSFIDQMGMPTANILLIEDRVNGIGAINNFIHAVFSRGQELKQLSECPLPEVAESCPTKGPEFLILDVTGSLYLGFKHVPGVVFHPDTPAPKRPKLHGQEDPVKDDYPAEVWEMVPLLEGAYRAYELIRSRVKERRKTGQGKPFPIFHRYVFIIRWWNVILMQWNKLGKSGQARVRELWKALYPRPNAINIDLIDVVLQFVSLGDLVECQLVITTKTISSVKQLGMTEDDIGAFMFMVPGDYNAHSGFGFSAINRILKDNRWDFNKFPDVGYTLEQQQKRLNELLNLGISYTANTGHQIIFVGAQSSTIMPLAAFHEIKGVSTRIEDIDSDQLKDNYEHATPPPKFTL